MIEGRARLVHRCCTSASFLSEGVLPAPGRQLRRGRVIGTHRSACGRRSRIWTMPSWPEGRGAPSRTGRRGVHRGSICGLGPPRGGHDRPLPFQFPSSRAGLDRGGVRLRFSGSGTRGLEIRPSSDDVGRLAGSVGGPTAGRSRINLSQLVAEVVEDLPFRVERPDLPGDTFAMLDGHRPNNRLDQRNLGGDQ